METVSNVRALPIFRMGETDFYVDTRLGEFREVDAPGNCISMHEIRASADEATEFAFDRHTKNIYQEHINPDQIPAHVQLVIVPALSELDPASPVRKLNLPDNAYIKVQPKIRHKKGYKL